MPECGGAEFGGRSGAVLGALILIFQERCFTVSHAEEVEDSSVFSLYCMHHRDPGQVGVYSDRVTAAWGDPD